MKYINPVFSLLLLISTAALCHATDSESPTIASSNLIERAKATLDTFEGPRQSLIEELGNAGTPESEQMLIDILSFSTPDETGGMPPSWRSMQSMHEGEVRSMAARQLIRLGTVQVVPVLREWLSAGITNLSTSELNQQLQMSVIGLAEYRDTASLPLIEALYQGSVCHSMVQEISADAVATMGSSDSTNLLCRMLWNECLSLDTRCKIAATLARHDMDVGRDVLLAFYELGIARLKADRSGGGGVARATLATLGDSILISRLEDRASREPPGPIRNNITTLINEMTICSLPMDEVVKLAEDDKWADGMYKRYPAIQRLGRDGTPDNIRVLTSLKPWDTVETGAYELQQQMLRDMAANSIREIKKRNWKAFVKQ